MKKNMKTAVSTSLENFNNLSEENKLIEFGKMVTADYCVTTIVEFIKKIKPEEIENSLSEIARETIRMLTVYLRAGVDMGYCETAEPTEE